MMMMMMICRYLRLQVTKRKMKSRCESLLNEAVNHE